MLQNAYFFAKIGADTAENERFFADILSKTGNSHERAAGVLHGRGAAAPHGVPARRARGPLSCAAERECVRSFVSRASFAENTQPALYFDANYVRDG